MRVVISFSNRSFHHYDYPGFGEAEGSSCGGAGVGVFSTLETISVTDSFEGTLGRSGRTGAETERLPPKRGGA